MIRGMLVKAMIVMMFLSLLLPYSFIGNNNDHTVYANSGPTISSLSEAVILADMTISHGMNSYNGKLLVEITFDSAGKAKIKNLTNIYDTGIVGYAEGLESFMLGAVRVWTTKANDIYDIRAIKNGTESVPSYYDGGSVTTKVISAGHKNGVCSINNVQTGKIKFMNPYDQEVWSIEVGSNNSLKFFDENGVQQLGAHTIQANAVNSSTRIMTWGEYFAWQDVNVDGVWELVNGDGRYSTGNFQTNSSAKYPNYYGNGEYLYSGNIGSIRPLVYGKLGANVLMPGYGMSMWDDWAMNTSFTLISTPCGNPPTSPPPVDSGGGSAPVVVMCSDGSVATKKSNGTYECKSSTANPNPNPNPDPSTDPGGGGGGGGEIINQITNITIDGGGPLIEIPRYDYDHSFKDEGDVTIIQNTNPGENLGEVKDNSKEADLKGTVTNIPNNGIVYLPSGGFQPHILVQSKNESGLLPSGTEETLTVSNFLKDHDDINITVNTIDLNKHSIDGKTINDFKSIYTKCTAPNNTPTGDNGITCTKVNKDTGVADLNNFKITKPGRQLLVVYLKDSKGKEYVYYKVVDARELGEFTGLPIQNRLTAMVENKSIKEKTTSKSHQFTDLKFTFSGSKEDSLAVPSINNATTSRIVLGSTEKGVKLLNNDLTPVNTSGVNLNNAPISDVEEVSGTVNTLVSSSTEGVFIIDTKTGRVIKINGLLGNKVHSIELQGSVLYLAFEDAVGAYYVDSANNAHLRDSITSQEIFGSNLKLGELNLVGSAITINTHHSNSSHKMAIISKF